MNFCCALAEVITPGIARAASPRPPRRLREMGVPKAESMKSSRVVFLDNANAVPASRAPLPRLEETVRANDCAVNSPMCLLVCRP